LTDFQFPWPNQTTGAKELVISTILPHLNLPTPLQQRVEALAKIFGVDEEHAMLRSIRITELLLAVSEQGGQIIVELNGSQYLFEIGNPTIPI
jgi:hypothetical protein